MRGDDFFAEISKRPPLTKLHPRLGAFFKDYLAREKAVAFRGQHVVNTHFPPYPSSAFDRLVEQFGQLGDAAARRLYSVTVAVTNRCPFNCWHCYNAGRSQSDMPLEVLERLAADLQQLGAVMVTLTGGEPMLRADLAAIARAFGSGSCLILGTTGDGLSAERARELKDSGVFAAGISLDSVDEAEHDRMRGRPGAFRTALRAIRIAREQGLYPYVVAVATRDLIGRERFFSFLRFAGEMGALEVHLMEPAAAGRLAGRTDVMLAAKDRRRILEYQAEVARDDTLPILSCLSHIESPDAFGCGAGLTHLYIDGAGEVCPCNLVPLSFGNVSREGVETILDRMGRSFVEPRPGCVGRMLSRRLRAPTLSLAPEASAEMCRRHLPRSHVLPRFFQIRAEARGDEVGPAELQAAYDRVHGDYDEFWLAEAAAPIDSLIAAIPWQGRERVFEAGAGTGYATAQLARKAAEVVAADLSEGMLACARARLQRQGSRNVRWLAGDALACLETEGRFDCVFSSWVLGYIPLKPFFDAARRALLPDGRLAFVVHRENSPQEPLEIFAELVAEDPSVLQKRVAFDFPRGARHVRTLIESAGFKIEKIGEGAIEFRYATAREALEHLLKSGAGTAYFDAIDPGRRGALAEQFLDRLGRGKRAGEPFAVRHEYVVCIAAGGIPG